MSKEEYDYINPSHYIDPVTGKETIEKIEEALTEEEFRGYLKGNSMKYRDRAGKKPDQPIDRDIKKALWYESKLIKLLKLPF